MDYRIFLTTFITIFIAEMGDKTQFAAIAASTQTRSTWTVLCAVILALSLAGTLGVILGVTLGKLITPQAARWLSGSLFIAIGLWIFVGKA